MTIEQVISMSPQQRYYWRNQEKVKAYQRRYRTDHREDINARRKDRRDERRRHNDSSTMECSTAQTPHAAP